ncbi:DUF6077 domain-containing protein [Konateibacter massiliensis]|uniref:DUF6077 domain-containing protein n=1 Tax=Konateibacter massiliensis TaxID=2002841 RepID=UPI000C1555BA|nr:DUF6077 domain-containing protein [Konateibacter massiliensis]
MLKSFEMVILFFVVALLLGIVPIRIAKEKQSGMLKAVLYGCIMMLVLFELLAVPATMMGQSLTMLTMVWAGVVVIIVIISAVTAKSYLKEQVKSWGIKRKSLTYLDGIILVLILIQIVVCVRYVFLHANDAYYVGMTATTLSSDKILAFSPYTGTEVQWSDYKYHVLSSLPVFWAMLAKISGVSAAFMCHTVVPMLFIPIGYILYREIGLLLFKQDKRAMGIFLLIICVGNFFIGRNYASSYEMLSTTIWQGGSFLYNIALPGIFYFGFKLLRKNRTKIDLVMLFMMIIVGIMTVPTTGIVLSILLVAVLGFSFTIEKMITRRKRKDAGIHI